MNDNLAAMVTEDERANEAIEIPVEETTTEVPVPETRVETSQPQEETFDVTTTALYPWFMENENNIGDNVKYVTVKIKDVNPEEDLHIKIPHPHGITDDEGKITKKMKMIEYANSAPVLNLPGIKMDVFNTNIFRIIYATPIEDTFIKFYGVSAKHIIFCKDVNNMLIPYSMQKLKKNDKGFNIVFYSGDIEEKLNAPVAMEDLILRYKQIEKHQDGIITNKQAIEFFNMKMSTVIDINHLLEIDKAMISIVA